jgi:DNA-binding NarL/FixJ family response regulator
MAAGRRISRAALSGSLDKPLIALQAATTSDALIKAVMALLQRAIACDFVGVFFRLGPHAYGSVPFRFIDSRGRDFAPELVEGVFFREHPAMPILMANPGIKFINTRETLPPEESLRASRFYREVMQVLDFRHAIGMYFWDDPPQTPEAVFSPCRVEGQPDFTDEDVAVLERLHPHIDAALRRARAIEKERAVRGELHGLIDPTRAACVLHWDLTVAEESRAAREMCARWNHGVASAHLKPPPVSLPGPLRDACSELKQRWSASLQRRPTTGTSDRLTVQHSDQPSLSATVSLHVHHTAALGKPAFLIEFELPKSAAPLPRGTSDKAILRSFTPQERDLIRLVAAGKSNQEIASETGKAVGSIKNALHTIFGKAGVRSRSALIARVGGGRHAGAASPSRNS